MILINQINRLYKIEDVLGRKFTEMLDRVELQDPFFYEPYQVNYDAIPPIPPIEVLRLDPKGILKIKRRIQDNYSWFFLVMYLLDNVDLEQDDVEFIKSLVRVQCNLAGRLRRLQEVI